MFELYFLTVSVSAVSYSWTRWLLCEVAFCLRTVPRLGESRHTSIVRAAEQAAFRSVGSRVSWWLPAPEREEGVWPGHVQPCAGSCGSSEEGNWETWSPTQTADRHTDRWRADKQEGKPTWTLLKACRWLSVLTENKTARHSSQERCILLL